MRRVALRPFSILILLIISEFSTSAWGAVPDQITLSGTLSDSSSDPVSGTLPFRVRFYDAQTSGNQLGSDLIGSVTISADGVFNLPLVTPTEVLDADEAWYELAIDTDED